MNKHATLTLMDDATALPDVAVNRRVLICDLDELITGDLRLEAFWAGFAVHGLSHAMVLLGQTRPLPKRVDVSHLPFQESRIAALRAWRRQGLRVVLVTGADQGFAEAVARHLDLFDEVHGSVPEDERAELLDSRFGAEGFDHIESHTVPAPRSRADLVLPMLKALRPHQWAKNGLIFVPLLAGHALELVTLFQAVLAFVAFSMVASSVYLLNDLLDLAADRAHPRKRNRPFASGALPLSYGTWMALGLLALGAAVGTALGPVFLAVLAGYYALTTLYSFALKERPIIDICTLAGLYALRIVAGGAATGIGLSVWLLAFSIFFFFSLAAVKRQAELVDGLATGRKMARRGYRVDDLPLVSMMALAAGYVSVMVMALYVHSPEVRELYSKPEMLWGICAVLLYWLSRIVFITHRGRMHDDPVVFAARDRVSQLLFIVVLGIFSAGSLL
ncbi:UbiA family prenyltransferase [Pseudooceanicola sp.]|uniref:UbiA family prenyltransferase n=1 Tax=Pseudooceanicola sp. TaxID=1914328 RepID=UPI00261728D6|nr:UbiA family prenyltransferase [Pseudooceanicola sp.]MDF1855984.1 UbiA family prenyltransferase [Pseudooceanicola sp.]